MTFWQKLKMEKTEEKMVHSTEGGAIPPILVLAPMADVTDAAFRRIIAEHGKPDVMWTEFVSADGLFRGGYDALISDLKFTEAERPIVAQFFTSSPEMMEKAAALACELGFDGVDINMGCPDKSVEKGGAGAAMIKNPERAKEIILAAKRGAGSLPVSVKTRIGYNTNELETWLPAILSTNPAVVTIHARTRKEMSLVPARWEHVKRAVEIRDELQSDRPLLERTLIFGNGDVRDIAHANTLAAETDADGVMIGRGIFGNPWFFNGDVGTVSLAERLRVLVEHTKLFEQIVQPKGPLGAGKSFAIMKKHFKAYVNGGVSGNVHGGESGREGMKELRMQLMEATNAHDVEEIIEKYIQDHLI